MAPRHEVRRLMWKYINKMDLKNGPVVVCNPDLKALFGVETIEIMDVAKRLNEVEFISFDWLCVKLNCYVIRWRCQPKSLG